MRRSTCILVLIASAAVSTTATIGSVAHKRPAPAHKLDRALTEAIHAGDSTFRVLVKARNGSLARVREKLTRRGQHAGPDFPSLSTISATVDSRELARLDADLDVQAISSDAVVQSSAEATWTSSTPLVTDNRLVRSLGMDYWVPNGSGVVVAVIDSGVVANSSLQSAAKYDFTTGAPKAVAGGNLYFDAYGHGSHVASLIGNTGSGGEKRYRGVAPSARILALKVLDNHGAGYTSNVIAAIEFCIANKYKLKIDIINLSLGHPIYEPAATDPLVQAVERAVRAGMAVIVSAGNYGRNPATGEIGFGGITSPGNAPSAISVGAVDSRGTQTLTDDVVAPYSSRGPSWYDAYAKPDFVVSGSRLAGVTGKASYLTTHYPASITVMPGAGHNFLTLSGTSMAAAVTSGVAAEVLKTVRLATGIDTLTYDGKLPASMQSSIQSLCSKYGIADCAPFKRGITPSFLKAILQYTAVPMPGAHPLEQGAGELNPTAAFELAKHFTLADIEKRFKLNDLSLEGRVAFGTVPQTRIGAETWNWSQHIVWGDHIIWGDTINFAERAWALHIVWGDHIIWGDHIVWGDTTNSVVWNDHIVWGDHIIWGDASLNIHGNHIVWGDLREVTGLQPTVAWSPGEPDAPFTANDPY